MSHQPFDEFVRGVGGMHDRRSALGLLTGAVLAAWSASPGESATARETKGHNECKDKEEKQKAKRTARHCMEGASAACLAITPDVFSAAACAVEVEACCHFAAGCLEKQARQCIRKVRAKYTVHH